MNKSQYDFAFSAIAPQHGEGFEAIVFLDGGQSVRGALHNPTQLRDGSFVVKIDGWESNDTIAVVELDAIIGLERFRDLSNAGCR